MFPQSVVLIGYVRQVDHVVRLTIYSKSDQADLPVAAIQRIIQDDETH